MNLHIIFLIVLPIINACRHCMFYSTTKFLPFVGNSNHDIIISPITTHQSYNNMFNLQISRSSGSIVTKVASCKTKSRVILHQNTHNDEDSTNDTDKENHNPIPENEKERKLLEALLSKEEMNDLQQSMDKEKEPTIDPANVSSQAMISSIKFYKSFISPLLPPACRFVPTCSQYGIAAIEKFGPIKGGILTVWRLMRCTPLGGKGYDPPVWPPVSYTHSSY